MLKPISGPMMRRDIDEFEMCISEDRHDDLAAYMSKLDHNIRKYGFTKKKKVGSTCDVAMNKNGKDLVVTFAPAGFGWQKVMKVSDKKYLDDLVDKILKPAGFKVTKKENPYWVEFE